MRVGPGLPARGSCFGYEVRSDLEFRYLRAGGGDRLEVVVEALTEPPGEDLLRELRPPRFPVGVRLYGERGGYRLWIQDAGWFGIDLEIPRLVVPPAGDPVRREERMWGLPVLLCFLARGDVPLHAACVEIEGRALVLSAPSQRGKTTLATAFAAAGYRVLAEDLVCLRPGSAPTVIPGPTMLRVRTDVAAEMELPAMARELGRDDERAHLALDSGRGTCDPVPVAGIAFLHEGSTSPRLEPTGGAPVVRDLWALSFNLSTDEDRARCFQAVTDLASAAPTWNLFRRLRFEDLRPTVERLAEAVRGAT